MEKTITETIKTELLDSVENSAVLESILQQHSHSKGPLYIALAQATNELTQRLKNKISQYHEAEQKTAEWKQQLEFLECKAVHLENDTAAKSADLVILDKQLSEKELLLDMATTISGLGFGATELATLHDILVNVGATHGEKPKQSITTFFQKVHDYNTLLGLDAELSAAKVAVATAKAELEQRQAELKAAEAKSKARNISIEFVENMIGHGVKESDLPQWTKIVEKSGIPLQELAHAFDQFASLEKLCKERQNKAAGLQTSIQSLTAQVTVLKEERDQIGAAIKAVRDSALAEIDLTSQKTMANLNILMQETENYKKLQQEAAALGNFLSLAKAIRGHDQAVWCQVDTATICVLLSDIMCWCQADLSHNHTLKPLTGSLAQKGTFYSWYSITLSEVLLWALDSLRT
jgi:hypothetical protein